MSTKLTETTLEALPQDLRHLVAQNIGTDETFLFGVISANRHGVVIITDYKLAEFKEGDRNFICRWPERGGVVGLERIKAVEIVNQIIGNGGDIRIDYGLRYNDEIEWLTIPLKGNDGLMKQFHQELIKAVANAFVRVRTPASKASIPDMGDQLLKLAELRKSGAIIAVQKSLFRN